MWVLSEPPHSDWAETTDELRLWDRSGSFPGRAGVGSETRPAVAAKALGDAVDRPADVASDVPIGGRPVVHPVGIDEHQLLRADVYAVHVLQRTFALDSNAVDGNTISALQVSEQDGPRLDQKHRVPARNQPVGHGKATCRAPTDGELLPGPKLEVGRLISQSKTCHPKYRLAARVSD